MRYNLPLMTLAFTLLLFSCKKDHPPVVPPPAPTPKILLKNIDITRAPSPFYHFEYNKDSTISRAGFEDGVGLYDVFYSGNKIAEMRDMNPANKDTLRYVYDSQGKLRTINIIDDDAHVITRRFNFTFEGNMLKKIQREEQSEGGFVIYKIQQFDYYSDGNLKTKIDQRRTISGESSDTTLYEQYDNKVNVDDFDIVNGSINEHLLLFQGFRLQKNNPGKVTFTQPGGVNNSVTTYIYTYNPDNTPSKRMGDALTAGIHTLFDITYTYY